MADTNISWASKVYNPITGCTMIGEGCTNCYALAMSIRLKKTGNSNYQNAVNDKGQWTGKITTIPSKLEDPLKWKKPCRIFVDSMSDLFHKNLPIDFFNSIMDVIFQADWHMFQVLTKRYDRAPDLLMGWLPPKPHIFIGYSICTQKDADKAIHYLRKLHDWGWKTWISYEPALEDVDFRGYEFIDWMVCGAESGKNRRPFDVMWAMNKAAWCKLNHIPFFMKQDSGLRPGIQGRIPDWLWDIKEYPEVEQEEKSSWKELRLWEEEWQDQQ